MEEWINQNMGSFIALCFIGTILFASIVAGLMILHEYLQHIAEELGKQHFKKQKPINNEVQQHQGR